MGILTSGLIVVLLTTVLVLLVDRPSFVRQESTVGEKIQQIGLVIPTEESEREHTHLATSGSLGGDPGTNPNSTEKILTEVEQGGRGHVSTIKTLANNTRDAKQWKDWFNIGRELTIKDDSFPKDLTRELDNWECPCNVRKGFRTSLCGFDSENKPIWIVDFRMFNTTLATLRSEKEAYLETLLKCLQQHLYLAVLSEGIKSNEDQPIKKFNYIVDFDGFSTASLRLDGRLATDFSLVMVHTYRPIFLKHLDKVFIMNVNPLADILLGVMRHSFRRLLLRSDIHGVSRSEWGPALLNFFPKDQVPLSYGGTLEKPFYRHWERDCEIINLS